jgi:hypothetical protein
METPDASPEPEVRMRARRTPFAARVQAILIILMFVGLALILQQASKGLYQIGLPLLVGAAFLQIAFGNIPPSAGLARSLKIVVIVAIITAAVFVLSVKVAPTLIDYTR